MSNRPELAITIDDTGWANPARHLESPNQDARPDAVVPRLVIIHAISLPPCEFGGDAIERFFTNRLSASEHPYYVGIAGMRVSAHFFIRRDGSLVQFVPCLNRAWHAGASCWRHATQCNDYSVGIEVEGSDYAEYMPVQYETLSRLARALCIRYPIEDIVGHVDVAPARKTDPGPYFDWSAIELPVASLQRMR